MLQLHPGQIQSDGSLLFEFDLSVVLSAENKTIRFRGVVATGLIRHGQGEAGSHNRLVATGASNKVISTSLVITEGTVKNHLTNILDKLGMRYRTQAALKAKEIGLI